MYCIDEEVLVAHFLHIIIFKGTTTIVLRPKCYLSGEFARALSRSTSIRQIRGSRLRDGCLQWSPECQPIVAVVVSLLSLNLGAGGRFQSQNAGVATPFMPHLRRDTPAGSSNYLASSQPRRLRYQTRGGLTPGGRLDRPYHWRPTRPT